MKQCSTIRHSTAWRAKSLEAMRIDRTTGLLDCAHYIPSPNCDERPAEMEIDLVVIHGISLPPGQFGGSFIAALFTNTLEPQAHPYFSTVYQLRVSAHVMIRRDGTVVQFVPFHRRAWHAGESWFEGRARCNDFSIGVELEGSDDIPYTDSQYEALSGLLRALQAIYPLINEHRITGHCTIAPGRKTDPGPAFDWRRLRAMLASSTPEAR